MTVVCPLHYLKSGCLAAVALQPKARGMQQDRLGHTIAGAERREGFSRAQGVQVLLEAAQHGTATCPAPQQQGRAAGQLFTLPNVVSAAQRLSRLSTAEVRLPSALPRAVHAGHAWLELEARSSGVEARLCLACRGAPLQQLSASAWGASVCSRRAAGADKSVCDPGAQLAARAADVRRTGCSRGCLVPVPQRPSAYCLELSAGQVPSFGRLAWPASSLALALRGTCTRAGALRASSQPVPLPAAAGRMHVSHSLSGLQRPGLVPGPRLLSQPMVVPHSFMGAGSWAEQHRPAEVCALGLKRAGPI